MNAHPGPAAATSSPPRAGPAACATVKATAFSDTACGTSSGGTSSGTIACCGGIPSVASSPYSATPASSSPGVTTSASASAPSAAAASACHDWVAMIRRRRSSTSARAPAGSASRNVGIAAAVASSATSAGERVSSTISQPAAICCIQKPRFDTIPAAHRRRKVGLRSGAYGLPAFPGRVRPLLVRATTPRSDTEALDHEPGDLFARVLLLAGDELVVSHGKRLEQPGLHVVCAPPPGLVLDPEWHDALADGRVAEVLLERAQSR
jgi:hypothetical protein